MGFVRGDSSTGGSTLPNVLPMVQVDKENSRGFRRRSATPAHHPRSPLTATTNSLDLAGGAALPDRRSPRDPESEDPFVLEVPLLDPAPQAKGTASRVRSPSSA
jgi:hypothetical protein